MEQTITVARAQVEAIFAAWNKELLECDAPAVAVGKLKPDEQADQFFIVADRLAIG